MTSIIVLRFLCGVFASSGPALGVATCADVGIISIICGTLSSAVATTGDSVLTHIRFGHRKSEVGPSAYML